MADQEAVAWWQFVEATEFKPMTKAQFEAIPVRGGHRGQAIRAHEEARAVLYPPDLPEE